MSTDKKPEKDGPPPNDVNLKRHVYEAMRSLGWIIPTTEEDVERAEALLSKENIELPEELRDPYAILASMDSNCPPSSVESIPAATAIEENLARAAREGGAIQPEIEQQMRRDCQAAAGDSEVELGEACHELERPLRGGDPCRPRAFKFQLWRLPAAVGVLLAGAALIWLLLGLPPIGWRQPVGKLHGKVYYKDKALSSGTVKLIADGKTVGMGSIQADGSYAIQNVPVGKVTILVMTGTALYSKPSPLVPPFTLPKEYSDPDKSPEKMTITTEDQEMDIRIKGG
jgi:hypothetical protein